MKLFDKTKKHKDKVYANICNHPNVNNLNQVCEEILKKVELYLDKGFREKIRENTLSCMWEMFLCYILINNGKKINELKQKKGGRKGPDFCIEGESGQRTWVEAISVKIGENKNKVKGKKAGWVESLDMSFPIMLRFTSAIEEKYKKYAGYYKESIIKDDDHYIIAVCYTEISHETLFDARKTIQKILKTVTEPEIEIPKKGTEKTVATGYFNKMKYSGISAVLFNCFPRLPINDSDIVDNVILVHNQNAKNPLEKGWLGQGFEVEFKHPTYKLTDYKNGREIEGTMEDLSFEIWKHPA